MVETIRGAAERHGVEVDDELLVGQWTVDPSLEGIRLPTSTRIVPVRWVPYAGQTVVPEWLYEPPTRPRVAMSLGLSQRKYLVGGWGHVPNLMEMVSTLDIEVIATLDERQLAGVPKLPDNVRTVDYVPLNQLLPTCTAMLHHGGMGTFAAACALNVPQLITDWDAENQTVAVGEGMEASKHVESTVTAEYVTARGAGLPLDINVSVDAMRKQLVRILEEPSFKAGAARVYEDVLSTPSPNDIVPILEKLTARYRGLS
jgi:glycosyltransferase